MTTQIIGLMKLRTYCVSQYFEYIFRVLPLHIKEHSQLEGQMHTMTLEDSGGSRN